MTRLLAVSCILLLAACNTIQGVGQDITNAGRTLENATR